MLKRLMAGVTKRSFGRATLYLLVAGLIAVFLRYSIVGLLAGPAFFSQGFTDNATMFTFYFFYSIPFVIFLIIIGSRGWFTAIAVKNEVPFLRRVGIRVLTTVCVAISLANFSTLLFGVPSSAVAAFTSSHREKVAPPPQQQVQTPAEIDGDEL